ncbi:MAG: flagellar hook basal-body protein [Bryobacterales bacterium]|nr:flagellar hook basal-body protein [Bryobacteraceae bacterium]MDW8355266.1 flagellar hook basal-body protein [Bryobacterales bacterium]
MDALTIAAASGLRARMESLEMLANNLANQATEGFKADREFYSLYISAEAAAATAHGDSPYGAVLPVIERHWTDFSQGSLKPTKNPLHLALSGPGFFAVHGPSGPLYTRNGNFRISASGLLVTADGYPLRAVGGGTIAIPAGEDVEVAADGTVTAGAQVVGQLELVDFAERHLLVKRGKNYFEAPAGAQRTTAAGAVQQGALESSNVSAPEAAARLVSVLRQFEMLQRAIAIGAEMNRRAVEEVARVNP